MSCTDTSHSSPASAGSSAASETARSVSVTPRSTVTPSRSIGVTSLGTDTTVTSCASASRTCPRSISSLAGSLARLFQSLECEQGLPTPEVLSFLKSAASSNMRGLTYCYLRTSRGFLVTTKGLRLPPSSVRLMNWGMTSGGRCLTARITECPRTESGFSLSEILEEHPDPKYFLSRQVTARIARFGLRIANRTFGTLKHRTGGAQNDETYICVDLHQPNVNACRVSRTAGQKG